MIKCQWNINKMNNENINKKLTKIGNDKLINYCKSIDEINEWNINEILMKIAIEYSQIIGDFDEILRKCRQQIGEDVDDWW